MKKSLSSVLIAIAVVALVIVGLNITGQITWGPDFQGIFRAVPFKNIETNTTDVYLRVASSENVIAIQEFFSSEDCYVVDYSLNNEISIFEFNENENTWIFANRSDILDVELFYQIPYNCDVDSGKYYTVDSFNETNECYGGDTNNDGVVDAVDYITMKRNFMKTCASPSWCDGADMNKDGKVNLDDLNTLASGATTSECAEVIGNDIDEFIESLAVEGSSSNAISPSGSSGSSTNPTSTSSPNQMGANEIIQTTTDKEYETRSLSIAERLAGIRDESKMVKKSIFYPFLILILIAIVIVIIAIIFIFFKKPKDFTKNVQIKKQIR